MARTTPVAAGDGRHTSVRHRRALMVVAAVLLTLSLTAVAFTVSPAPGLAVMRTAFFSRGNASPPADFDRYRRQVVTDRDLTYPSAHRRNTYDLYRPADLGASRLPVIVWVHGGGFIGGDKAAVSAYATMLAARGFAVAAMNYDYAPAATYPTPVRQVGEMVDQIRRVAPRYGLDPGRLILGGDSAGAQIAAQFALVQTTPGYARTAGIARVALSQPIEAMILFCGPYDVKRLSEPIDSWLAGRFVNLVGWGYLGSRDWRNSDVARKASIADHVTGDFPRTYVTDGSSLTFTEDARTLIAALQAKGVAVQYDLFPEAPDLPHEFQFDFSHPQSVTVWKRVSAFLQHS